MVLCKGKEFDNMMADLMKYRESTIRQCDLLMECEGNILRKSMQSSVTTQFEKLHTSKCVSFSTKSTHSEKKFILSILAHFEEKCAGFG